MPTQSIDELIFDVLLAFDEGRKVKEAFAAIGKAPAPASYSCSTRMAYWSGRRSSRPPRMLKQGQFAEQCALLLAGKPLIDNGARPAADDEDDEGEEIAADLGELDIPGRALANATIALTWRHHATDLGSPPPRRRRRRRRRPSFVSRRPSSKPRS